MKESQSFAFGMQGYTLGNDNTLTKANGLGPRSSSLGPPADSASALPRKSKFSGLGRWFKPWKWRRKRKSERFEAASRALERKMSVRANREELIQKGILPPETPTLPPLGDVGDSAWRSEAVQDQGGGVPTLQVQNQPMTTFGNPRLSHISLGRDDPAPHCSNNSNFVTPSSFRQTPATRLPEPHHDTKTVMTESERATAFFHKTDGEIYPPPTPGMDASATVGNGVSMMELPEPPIPLSEIGPIPPPPMFSTPSPLPPRGIVQMERDRIQQREREQSLAAAIALVVQNVRNKEEVVTEDSETDEELMEAELRYEREVAAKKAEEVPAKEPRPYAQPAKSAMKSLRRSEGGNSGGSTPTQQSRVRPIRFGIALPLRERNLNQEAGGRQNGSYDSDSDGDGPVLYKDEESHENSSDRLASKIARKDSLALKLAMRPDRQELIDRNIIRVVTEKEQQETKEAIGAKLIRRLSMRPSQEELEERNILKKQTPAEERKLKEEKKKMLLRKLSFRPTIEELKEKKIIRFNDYIEVTQAQDYDRRADKPWTRLTPKDKAAIRKELNEFKSTEMEVHQESRHLIRFHRP